MPHHARKRAKDSSSQQQFNWQRADCEAALKALQLNSMSVPDGATTVRVSGAHLKSVLWAMVDYMWTSGVFYASSQTIADEIRRSERHVRRGFTGLELLQLLILLDNRAGRAKRYGINWGEIVLKSPRPNPGHSDANPGHSVRRTLRTLKEPPPIQKTPGAELGDWQAVEAVLLRLPDSRRPTAWHDGLRAARSRGVTPEYVLAIIEHYNAQGPAYSAGALYRRLQRSHPDVHPTQDWPKPQPSPSATPVRPAHSLMSETTRRDMTEIRIRKAGKSAGKTEAEIDTAVARAIAREFGTPVQT